MESWSASKIISWACEMFPGTVALSASFQDCVLIDLTVSASPDVPVIFLDTQYHFEETLTYVHEVQQRYGFDLHVVEPLVEPDDRWREDQNSCCRARKVEPLRRALEPYEVWLTGLRRAEASSRAEAPPVSWDDGQGVLKINPLVRWSDEDVARYIAERGLPIHPLSRSGFGSIGCWPCTRAVTNGEHARSGRWADSDKTECGLHVDVDVAATTEVSVKVPTH